MKLGVRRVCADKQPNNVTAERSSSVSQLSLYLKLCISILKIFQFLHFFSIHYTIIQNALKFVSSQVFLILFLYYYVNLCGLAQLLNTRKISSLQ